MGNVRLFLKGFKKGFKECGDILSRIVNGFALLIVFIFGIGLISVISKLFHKKYLDKNFKSKSASYWVDSNIKNKKKEDYYKPF